jgi:hypothetical protein
MTTSMYDFLTDLRPAGLCTSCYTTTERQFVGLPRDIPGSYGLQNMQGIMFEEYCKKALIDPNTIFVTRSLAS